jgi:excisionase family DNA binding protein
LVSRGSFRRCSEAAKRPGVDGSEIRCATLDELRDRATCSVDQVAAVLGVGRSTAYAAVKDGSLPSLRCAHRILIPVPRLLALIEGE